MRLSTFLVALVAGLAQALSIAAPWNGQPVWWLQIVSLATLAAVVDRAPGWKAGALAGWTFATAWLCATFWWLFISMHVYGGLPSVLAVVAVFGLAAFLGSYYAAAAGAYAAWKPRGAPARAALFAGAWLLAELMRGTFFTGFPWGAGGYAHADGPLAFLASRIGVYGIGFVAAFVAMLAAAAAKGWNRASRGEVAWLSAAILLVAAGSWVPAASASTPHGRLSVALLQGNIPQEEKFQGRTGIPDALAWYRREMIESAAQLVVAPETAIPVLPQQLPEEYLQTLTAHFTEGPHAALIGIPIGNEADGYTNSVIGLAPGAPPYRFDKHHLVPFGEFIPPLFRWFTEMMHIPLGDFNRGPLPQPAFAWQGQRLLPNICYEDLFGEEIGRSFAQTSAAPTVLVNLSNIGWFGDSVAIDQHLQISRMRALEFDRPVVRATNTGATAVIDHDGRVLELLPRLTRGILRGDVQGRTTTTLYAAWVSRAGLLPLWGLGLALAAFFGWRKRRHP